MKLTRGPVLAAEAMVAWPSTFNPGGTGKEDEEGPCCVEK